jgi:hypothetical protein
MGMEGEHCKVLDGKCSSLMQRLWEVIEVQPIDG